MSETSEDLAILQRSDSTLPRVMQAVAALEKNETSRRCSIGLSSSATIELLGLYLRKQGLLSGVRIDIHQGNFDDPIGDVDLFLHAGIEYMVLLPLFDSLLPSFEAQLEGLSPDTLDAKEQEFRARYRLALENGRALRTIFLGTFHRLGFNRSYLAGCAADAVLARFNRALREEAAAFGNVRTIDTEDIVRTIGQGAAFDPRFYFRAKAPYASAFFDELAHRISLASRGFGSQFYKVLVLDCDNTLWGGVIGEDLLAGIKLGPHDYPGNIFWRVQHEIASLERKGILICLCSKNNPADVDEVLQKHPDMVLRESQISLKKINWNDKPANLREIAKSFNVGLDSMVFLDDSSFECEAVRTQLPMVRTVQVPPALADYPGVLAAVRDLFLAGGISADSQGKTMQYRQLAQAEVLKAQFDTQEAYLTSLELKVELTLDARASIARISELSMKSNQFNLTGRRYGEGEIAAMMQAPDRAVYSLVVGDKFGSAGLTGVAVIRFESKVAHVENLFLSCRIIGRGVEMAIWSPIVAAITERGCSKLLAEYVPSAKNAQVADFYDRIGLRPVEETSDGIRRFEIDPRVFVAPKTPWIELVYAG